MNKKIKMFTVILVLTLIFSVFQVFPVKAQPPKISVIQVYWGTQTEKIQAKPGDKNLPLNIVVLNIDQVEMLNVKAKLILSGSPFSTPTGEKEAYSGFLSILPGQQAIFTFILDVDEKAKLGIYNLEMDITSQTQRYLTGVTSVVTVSVPLYGEVRFSAIINPKTIFPGPNNVTLTLKNIGEADASDVNVMVNIPSPLTVRGEDNIWFFSKIGVNESLNINMEIYASKMAVGGAYPLSITVTYKDAYGNLRTDSKIVGLAVENPTIKPLIKLKINPEEIVAGEKNLVNVTLKNLGDEEVTSLDIMLTLPMGGGLGETSATTPLILLEEDNFWHFEKVKPKTSIIFPVHITTSKSVVGTFQLTFTLTYKDSRGQTQMETRNVGLTVKPKTPSSMVNIESYKVKPNIIYQGDIFNLTLNLKNFGNFEAQMVTVMLTPPNLFATLTPSIVSLGNLKPSETGEANFRLMVSPSAEAGVAYPFRIDIYYVDSLGIKQVTTNTLGIPLYGRIDFVIYDVSTLPSPTHLGKEFTVSFTILNRGNSPAMYTNISIIPSTFLQLTSESSTYIGQVDPNAPAPASLSAILTEDKPGTYPIKILVSYRDKFNKPYQLTYEIPVKAIIPPTPTKTGQTQPKIGFAGFYATPIIILIVLIVALLFWMRKRKRKS